MGKKYLDLEFSVPDAGKVEDVHAVFDCHLKQFRLCLLCLIRGVNETMACFIACKEHYSRTRYTFVHAKYVQMKIAILLE